MAYGSNYYNGGGTLANVSGGEANAVQLARCVSAMQALQTAVGSEDSGMIKAIADLQTAVEALQTAVGDADSGLVKDVSDLKTVVGDSSSGLVKRVSDLENA